MPLAIIIIIINQFCWLITEEDKKLVRLAKFLKTWTHHLIFTSKRCNSYLVCENTFEEPMTQEDNIKLRVVDEESECGCGGGGGVENNTAAAINGHEDAEQEEKVVCMRRTHSVVHPPVDAPLCTNCRQIDLEFFDPSCPGCRQILVDPSTTIAQIMACMRQWVPQTQRNIDLLVDQVLRRGAHPNDRDGLTDLTLLHFSCRAGASGVGDGSAAARAVVTLVSLGADVNLSCKWTHLSSLHYAAYFDASPIVHLLLETAPQIDINSICPGYDSGMALHIAASNLCLETARVLLRHGAKLTIKDSLGRTPKDCVPDVSHFENVPHVHEVISMLKRLLTMGDGGGGGGSVRGKGRVIEPVSGRALLRSMGLVVGGRVLVAGMKSGTLRFCGTTEFAVGLWIGVELDTPDGKNDGSIHGVTYFKCSPNHGIFVPINKITKIGSPTLVRRASVRFSTPSPQIRHHAKMDLSKITSKIETGLALSKSTSKSPEGETQFGLFKIGDRVLVGGKRKATVRYFGQTKFATGYWYGLELDKGGGKNDGSVQGVRYFACPPNCGIFSSPSRVTHLLTSSEDCITEIDSFGDGPGSGETRTLSNSPDPDFNGRVTMNGHTKRSPFRMSFRIKSPNKSPRTATLRSVLSPNTSTLSSPQNGRLDKFYLNEGVNVLVNNELGIVRYVGHVEFSDGVWIGVELRLPHGKNNGTVQGKQYFQCKANHGLLVRPNKVTVHGLNGASLLPEYLMDSNGSSTTTMTNTTNETTKL